MAIPAAIRAHFRDDVTVKVVTNHDAYGDPVYADPVTVPARVTYRKAHMVTPRGDEFVSSIRVYMPDVASFTADAQIVLPDGTDWTVKAFNRPAWPDGTRHLEVDL
jgi:hypothetical protein